MAENSAEPAPSEPIKKKRGLFGLLFKSTLGCAAFAAGSLVALVLLLPTILSSPGKGMVESAFAEHCKGRLTIGKLHLAWFSRQSVEDAVLLDPDGVEVARASLDAPSLVDLIQSDGKRIGRVTANVTAALVADDQGVSNLDRALAPRHPSAHDEGPDPEDEKADWRSHLAGLDAEVVLTIPRLTWSDADTRKSGVPFEIRDFQGTLTAKPQGGMKLAAHGKQMSEAPGDLSLDVAVASIDPEKTWPFGAIDARARVSALSTALLDAALGRSGDLRETLGPRFDLDVRVAHATQQSGEVRATLTSERCTLNVAANLDDGALTSGAEPLVAVRLAEPRRLLERALGPLAPSGTRWAWDPAPSEWTFAIKDVRVPMPAPDAPPTAWRTALASSTGELIAELPGALVLERETPSGAPVRLGIQGLRASLVAAGGAQPWKASVACALVGAAERGSLALETRLSDTAQALAMGVLPRCDVDFRVDGLATSALDSFFTGAPLLAEVLGPALTVDAHARDVSPQGGTLALDVKAERASVHLGGRVQNGALQGDADRALVVTIASLPDALLARFLPPPSSAVAVELARAPMELASRELTVPLPWIAGSKAPMDELKRGLAVDLSVSLPAGAITMRDSAQKKPARLEWRDARISARVQPGGALAVELDGALDAGGATPLVAIAKTADAWGWVSAADVSRAPPIDAEVSLSHVSSSFLDRWLAQDGRLATALGGDIDLSAAVDKMSLRSGKISARVESPALAIRFSGAMQDGALVARGEEGLRLKWRPTPAVSRDAGALLPKGAELTWPSSGGELSLAVREIAFPLPPAKPSAPSEATAKTGAPATEPATASAGSSMTATLRDLACTIELSCNELGYRDAKLRAAGLDPRFTDTTVRAVLAPREPAVLDLTATIQLDAPAKLEGHVKVDHWEALAMDASAARIDGSIDLTGLSTRALDALVANKPMIEPWLGKTADLGVRATSASAQGAELRAALRAPNCELTFEGSLRDGALVCGPKQGLDVALTPTDIALDAFVRDSFPAGTTIRMLDAKAPLRFKVSGLTLPLANAATARAAAEEKTSKTPESNGDRDARALPASAPNARGPSAGGPSASMSAASQSADALAPTDALALGASGAPALAQDPPKKLDPRAAAPPAAEAGADQEPADLSWLASLSAHVELEVPSFEYRDATIAKSGKPAMVRGMSFAFDAAPRQPPSIALKASIEAEQPGQLDARVKALDPLDVLARPGGASSLRVAIDVTCKNVPTAWVDAAAKQDGLLVGTIGPRLDLGAQSAGLSKNEGAFTVDLSSQEAKLHCEGKVEAGVLQIEKVDGLSASFGLTPVASERVVGRLVPALVQLEKPPGAEPVLLAVDKLSYPLNGDLSQLDALVRLDLGEVSYQLLPGLDELMSLAGQKKTARIAPIQVPIEKGVARYDALPVRVGSTQLTLKGSFNLATQSLAMTTDVPLSLLGKRVSAELDRVREYLKPDAAIPIEIRGHWKKPSVRIGEDFLKKVAGSAVDKGLEDLLKGALGGKKKKDKD